MITFLLFEPTYIPVHERVCCERVRNGCFNRSSSGCSWIFFMFKENHHGNLDNMNQHFTAITQRQVNAEPGQLLRRYPLYGVSDLGSKWAKLAQMGQILSEKVPDLLFLGPI